MRKLSQITTNIVPIRPAPQPYSRRPLASTLGHLTALVLVQHHATDKALLVSDDNDQINAVWIPRALLSIDPAPRGRFVVATLPQRLANEKRLYPKFIDPEQLSAEDAAHLAEAVTAAARSRLRLRGYQEPMGWSGGRNVFA